MQRLLDAVAATGVTWDMDCVSRKVGMCGCVTAPASSVLRMHSVGTQ
jgi:hypothetical protein